MATLQEQQKEVRREIRFRELCYPRWVREGRISRPDADRKLGLMRAVLKTLERLSRESEPTLFDMECK
jgi:hypothetical protein